MKRTGPIKKRPTRNPLPSAVKAAVLLRDPLCLSCGDQATLANHRFSGMGGFRPQTVAWLTGACSPCNYEYECSPLVAYENGWKLRQGSNPYTTPVADHAGRWWLLDSSGTRTPALPTQHQEAPNG